MTDRRDLKRRIRERQEKTGERYTTARAHVVAAREPPEWVVELTDVSARARDAGLYGIVSVTPPLRAPDSLLDAVLARLAAIVRSPVEGLGTLRRALVPGEPELLPRVREPYVRIAELRRFVADLELGLRGQALDGRLVAFDVPHADRAVTVVAEVLFGPLVGARRVVLSRYDGGKPRLVFFSEVLGVPTAR